MAIKVLQQKQDYEHMDLLNMPNSILSSEAIKIKAAAASWINGEFTLDEILEAIAQKHFNGPVTHDFEGRDWDCWDPVDYLDTYGFEGIYSHAQQTLGDNDDVEFIIVEHENQTQSGKTLTSEEEMETV